MEAASVVTLGAAVQAAHAAGSVCTRELQLAAAETWQNNAQQPWKRSALSERERVMKKPRKAHEPRAAKTGGPDEAPRQPVHAAQDHAAEGTGVDELPNIGKPATRALLGAGVRSLTDVAGRTEVELLALHGVGPKAIRLLSEAMAERGLKFSSTARQGAVGFTDEPAS
jgi:hypothetical protein